jgi:hypothetical protein
VLTGFGGWHSAGLLFDNSEEVICPFSASIRLEEKRGTPQLLDRQPASRDEPFVFWLIDHVGGRPGPRLRQAAGVEKLKNQLKGLILAQNERWRRGLGMQVVR